MQSIFYISTNSQWSGSEILWYLSALALKKDGYKIITATKYHHTSIKELNAPHFDLNNRYTKKSILEKITYKLFNLSTPKIDLLNLFIRDIRPSFIIISQGNNIEALEIALLAIENNIPYIILTQLVSEVHYLGINNYNLFQLQKIYLSSKKNYFVSYNNLELNNLMLGMELPNSEIVKNPCQIKSTVKTNYPSNLPFYNIGIVGRVEFFHKGFDFLIKIAKNDKWKNRSVRFNIYGDGPHIELLRFLINNYDLHNIIIRGHTTNISDVWNTNHILFMPSRMEGQALALLEAMMCSRAAIVTNVGGVKELLNDDSAFIAEECSYTSIEATLDKAWEAKEIWEKMGENAKKALHNYYSQGGFPVDSFNTKIKQHLEE